MDSLIVGLPVLKVRNGPIRSKVHLSGPPPSLSAQKIAATTTLEELHAGIHGHVF